MAWLGEFFGMRLSESGVTHGPGASGGHLPPVLVYRWRQVIAAIRELERWFGSYSGAGDDGPELHESPPTDLPYEVRDDYVKDGVRPFPEYSIGDCLVWVIPLADLRTFEETHPVSEFGRERGSNERLIIVGAMALVVYKS